MLAADTLINNRYMIIRLIGQGGMGAVYEAVDQRLGNHVALKQTLSGADFNRAFEREAKLLANLRHPVLPRVIDFFTDPAGQFLVMDYVRGTDLNTVLTENGGPLPLATVLGWADVLLDALAYLHRQTPPVIHRDIKPQNITLTPEGEIVLLDFGLAKGAVAAQPQLTASSIFGYTPRYAPFEQIEGSGTEVRSDLYALAATLLHLLTDVEPINALQRAAARMNGQPDPQPSAHELNQQIPLAISDVLQQALALRPDERPASAVALRDALRRAAQQPGKTVRIVDDAATIATVTHSAAATIVVPTPQPTPPSLPSADATQPPAPAPAPPTPSRGSRLALIIVASILGLLVACGLGVNYAISRARTATETTFATINAGLQTVVSETTATVENNEAPSPTTGENSDSPTNTPNKLADGGNATPETTLLTPPTAETSDEPTPEATLEPTTLPRSPFPADAVRATLDQSAGTVGAIVYDESNQQEIYSGNVDEVFPAASLIKLPIVLATYRLAEQGQLNLDDTVTMRAEDKVGGSGAISGDPADTVYTIRDLCGHMLRESDNTAANLILNKIGFDPVNALLNEMGAKQTHVQRLMLDTAAIKQGRDNVTTPQDMFTIINHLQSGALLSSESTEEILRAMAENVEHSKLPADLPSDVIVAHKTGTLTGVEHDAGLIQLPNEQRYIVILMIKDLKNNDQGIAAIAQASKQIYDWFAES